MAETRDGKRRWCAALHAAAVVVCLAAAGSSAAGDDTDSGKLQAQLQAIAEQERLHFLGLNRIADDPARPIADGDPLPERLDRLLSGYNYVLTVDAGGRPTTVRILGKRTHSVAPAPIVPVTVITTRRGRHHLVEATVVGRNGELRDLLLMVDTGASTVVLPQSLAAPLGFSEATLKDSVARTAAGAIAVRLGELRQVQVGEARARDVAVAFVDDATLGDGSLLGMSFLERFDVRLEDSYDRLTLRQR